MNYVAPELISPTCLREAFVRTDPKNIKIKSSCHYLFVLLGSAHVKALHKMLMKLTPDFENKHFFEIKIDSFFSFHR